MTINIKELLESGTDVDVAFFVTCDSCLGEAKIPVFSKGGPYGMDRNGLETCRRCYQRSGKKLVKVKLSEVVTAVRKMSEDTK